MPHPTLTGEAKPYSTDTENGQSQLEWGAGTHHDNPIFEARANNTAVGGHHRDLWLQSNFPAGVQDDCPSQDQQEQQQQQQQEEVQQMYMTAEGLISIAAPEPPASQLADLVAEHTHSWQADVKAALSAAQFTADRGGWPHSEETQLQQESLPPIYPEQQRVQQESLPPIYPEQQMRVQQDVQHPLPPPPQQQEQPQQQQGLLPPPQQLDQQERQPQEPVLLGLEFQPPPQAGHQEDQQQQQQRTDRLERGQSRRRKWDANPMTSMLQDALPASSMPPSHNWQEGQAQEDQVTSSIVAEVLWPPQHEGEQQWEKQERHHQQQQQQQEKENSDEAEKECEQGGLGSTYHSLNQSFDSRVQSQSGDEQQAMHR